MRFNPVYICPVHTVQITRPDSKIRYWKIESKVIPHREFIMERTEFNHATTVSLTKIIIRLPFMDSEQSTDKRYLHLVTESYGIIPDFKTINTHSRKVQIQIGLSRSRVIAVTGIVDKTTRQARRSKAGR